MSESLRAVRIATLAAIGLVIVFVAGGVSISRWAPSGPPGAHAPAPVPEAGPASAPAPAPSPHAPELAERAAVLRPTEETGGSALSDEERERRREIAARVRARIEEGPHEVPAGEYGGLLGAAAPVPVYQDGALLGIELQEVAPDGFYARMGLREGDLVQAINGLPLDSPALVGELAWALTASAAPVELSVERSDGRREQVALPSDALLGELQALGSGR